MAEETARTNEIVHIKINSLQYIRGVRGDNATISVKLEFRDKIIGESPKTETTFDQPALLEWSTNVNVNLEDSNFMDDLTFRPVIVTVTEILPKEKKQKDEKTQILGQCTFDLLPLLRGSCIFEHNLRINSVPGSPFENMTSEVPQPSIAIQVSCERPIISEEQLEKTNIMTITMESLYSPPEAFIPGTTGINYIAALSIPSSDEKENVLVFPSGSVKVGGEKDPHGRKIKWISAGSAIGESMFVPHVSTSVDEYDNEDGDLKDSGSRNFRIQSEKERNRVSWNMQRPTLLNESSIKILQSRIAKFRKWPIEIFRIGGAGAGKAAGRKDDESQVNFHGYAFVNLVPLLFPGVKRTRGAYKVLAFNENDYAQQTERKVGVSDESIRIANTLLHQSTTSIGGKKGADKKPEKKAGGGAKVPGSAMGVSSEVALADGTELGGGPTGSTPAAVVPVNVEGAQYEESNSYITLEIQLDRPLVRQRLPEEIAQRVSELIPPRDPLAKRSGSAEKAVEDYHNQIAAIAKQLLTEFRTLFEEELKDPDILNNQDAVEQMRQELIYDLNSSGKYFAFKEQLKYAVIKIVREKCLQTSTLTDPAELQEFLRVLFVFLVDELQAGLRKVITLKETKRREDGIGEGNAAIQKTTEQLYKFAIEADIDQNYVWADRYHRERLARNQLNPDFWLDYGIYLLSRSSKMDENQADGLAEAEHAFKKCVELSPQHLNGLVLYGLVCALQSRLEEAEIFLEAATTYHSKSIYAWTTRGLYYNSIGNEIQFDMVIQEAEKLNMAKLKDSKEKDIAEAQGGAVGGIGISARTSEELQQAGIEQTDTNRSISQHEDGNSAITPPHDDFQESILNEVVHSESVTDASQQQQPHRRASNTPSGPGQHKRSTITSISVTKSGAIPKVTSSPMAKSKESVKESDIEIQPQIINVPRSIYIKTAIILLKQKAFPYVEKALALELLHLANLREKKIVTDDKLNALSAEYNLILAKVHLNQNRFIEAESALLETVQIEFDNADAYSEFGHLKFLVGDKEAAENFYIRALQLTKDISEPHPVYMRLASLYLSKEKYTEAKQTFLLACKKNPTCLSWLGVGIACYRLDEIDQAEEALAEANILNNENAEVWAYLSLICLKTNRKVEAEQSYKYALRMDLKEHSETLLEEIQELQNEVGFGNPEL